MSVGDRILLWWFDASIGVLIGLGVGVGSGKAHLGALAAIVVYLLGRIESHLIEANRR